MVRLVNPALLEISEALEQAKRDEKEGSSRNIHRRIKMRVIHRVTIIVKTKFIRQG